jgi:hypothetical protein
MHILIMKEHDIQNLLHQFHWQQLCLFFNKCVKFQDVNGLAFTTLHISIWLFTWSLISIWHQQHLCFWKFWCLKNKIKNCGLGVDYNYEDFGHWKLQEKLGFESASGLQTRLCKWSPNRYVHMDVMWLLALMSHHNGHDTVMSTLDCWHDLMTHAICNKV